jgi:serine/threonine protein phosphatase PrpC
VVVGDLLRDIPLLPLSFIDSDPIVRRGPTELDEHRPQNASDEEGRWAMSGQSISTYPMTMTQGQKLVRDGDPICDSYVAQLYNSSTILCLTDGCGWGIRPRDASMTASNTFTEHIHKRLSEVKDSHAIAKVLFHGLVEAHYKVISGNDDAGTTTILGGVILPIGEQDGLSLFIFISVGDCKAYWRKASTGKVVDLSVRISAFDAKDPGGRIGPYNPDKMPDLRNLKIDFCICEAGDIIILVSDGVSDNFDPQHNGLMPLDLGMPKSDWKNVQNKEYALKCKSQWSCVKIAQLINTVEVSPESIVRVLLDYCVALTKSSRDFLQNVRGEKLPSDYVKYPGKMDHTTCLAVRIQSGT